MKVIEVKINNELVLCEQLKDLTTAQFLKKQKEAAKYWQDKEDEALHWKGRILKLENQVQDLFIECSKLRHEIAVDRGEVDEESEEHE